LFVSGGIAEEGLPPYRRIDAKTEQKLDLYPVILTYLQLGIRLIGRVRRFCGWPSRRCCAHSLSAFDRLLEISMIVDPALPILVVDDYQTMVRIIRNLLKQIGLENVDDASNGEEALAKIRSKEYGLIISDWNMEPMTGFQLLQKVREDQSSCSIPFIMVTAESKTDNVIAARNAGVSHYIVKPFNAATLKAKIDAVFAPVAA
jgi:two-component system, chemotaxis family, chemotaxis protein CheY